MRKTGIMVLLLSISFWIGARDWDVYWNFFAAVKRGDLNTVKILLDQQKKLINEIDANGFSPLQQAILEKNLPMVELLLQNGADIEQRTTRYYCCQNCGSSVFILGQSTPLLMASALGDFSIFNLLIQKGADLNKVDEMSCNLLHAAAMGGNLEIVKYAIKKGLKVDQEDQFRNTPLLLAVGRGKRETASFLLNIYVSKPSLKRALLKGRNISLLHRAAQNNMIDIADFCLKNGWKIDSQDDQDETPLEKAALFGKKEMVEWLLAKGAKLPERDSAGNNTILMDVLEKGYEEVAKIFFNPEKDFFPQKKGVSTLLHAAAKGGVISFAEQCLQKGLDINARGEDDKTPLYLAAENGQEKMVDFLLTRGADILIANRSKGYSSLLYIAAEKGLQKLAALCLEKGIAGDADHANDIPLMAAINSGHNEMVHFLLKKGSDINARNNDSETPLFRAAERGNLELFNLLLSRGADIQSVSKWGETVLIAAVEGGSPEIVKLCLEKGIDVNAKGSWEGSALAMAAEKGYFALFSFLLEQRADITQIDEEGCTVLHHAAKGGNLAIIDLCLKKRLLINSRDHETKTPLHYACESYNYLSNFETVKFLVVHGADVNAKAKGEFGFHGGIDSGTDDITPLHLAADHADLKVISFLLEKGVRVNEVDGYGNTPLYYAVENENPEVFRILIRNGAKINIKNNEGETPLHWAVGCGQGSGFSRATSTNANKNMEILFRILIQNGAKINVKNNKGETPLHWAVGYGPGRLPVIKMLVSLGADINQQDNEGFTPFILAAAGKNKEVYDYLFSLPKKKEKYFDANLLAKIFQAAIENENNEMIQFCIDKGVDLNYVNPAGDSLLHQAAASGNVGLVNMLLEKKKDISLKNQDKETPILLAVKNKQVEVVETLLKNGANAQEKNAERDSLIHLAAALDSPEVLQVLISHDCDVNLYSEKGLTPLHIACRYPQIDSIALLLAHGADINAKIKKTDKNKYDPKGATALFLAARDGYAMILPLLMERGSDIMIKTDNGDTILHAAAAGGVKDLMQMCLDKGIAVDVRNLAGETPLFEAVINGKKEAVEFLAAKGAGINVKDNYGWTPLHFAVEAFFFNKALIESLISLKADVNAKTLLQKKRTPLGTVIYPAGSTPLDLAETSKTLFYKKDDQDKMNAVIELLIKHGARSNRKEE